MLFLISLTLKLLHWCLFSIMQENSEEHRYWWMAAVCFWYAVRCHRSSYSLDDVEAFHLCSSPELLLLCLSIHLYVKVELWLPSGTIQQPVSSIDNTILWQIHHYAFKNLFNYIHLAAVGCYINVYGFRCHLCYR